MPNQDTTNLNSATDMYTHIGSILRFSVEQKNELEGIARDKSCPVLLRCAAMDRLGEIASADKNVASLFYFMARDLSEDEEIRVIGHQWGRIFASTDQQSSPRFRSTPDLAPKSARSESASDVLDRVRWLATLSD